MDEQALLSALGGWEEFEVTAIERRSGAAEEVWVTLQPKADEAVRCSGCGEPRASATSAADIPVRISRWTVPTVILSPSFAARTSAAFC